MTDTIVKLGSVAAVLGLSVGLIWFGWMKGRYAILAAINAVVATGIFLVSGGNLHAAILYNETPMLLFFAFEASVVIAFIVIFSRIRVPNFVVALQAVVNILLLALLALFLFTFRLTRLF